MFMYIDRRKFLLQSGAVALGSDLLPGSHACAADAGSDQIAKNLELAKLGQPLTEVLTLAAQAPSGHNTQPWTIRILDKEHWIVGIEDSRRLPGVDPTARETLLSLGAFLENLIIGASHYGYRVDYRIIATSPADSDVLDIRLRESRSSPQNLQRIKLRRTVRNGFRKEPIQSADLKLLMNYGTGLQYFAPDTAGAKYLAEGTVEANRQQAYRDPAEEELGKWIRWSTADAAKYRNGLTPASMEIEGIAGWYVSHFYNRSSVLSKSFRETTIKQVKERVGQGAGWLVVSSPDGALATLIETGRRVERMWLALRNLKLAIHPMTQMLEEVPWREQVARNLGTQSAPQFLLRVGYLNSYPNPTSLRMPASWIVSRSHV
jgi:hypothetical protein